MLTQPSLLEREHSARLSQQIHDSIRSGVGWIGFDHFMEQALYAPGLGYYAAGKNKIGDDGDFVTAPTLGSQFARCLANQFAEILEYLPASSTSTIVEFGAGTGQLMLDVLDALELQDSLPCRYLVIETSADLQQRQQQAVNRHQPKYQEIIVWSEQLPEQVSGIVFANEMLDAMPVKRFWIDSNGEAKELGIRHENGNYEWHQTTEALGHKDQERLAAYGLPAGYRSEIAAQAEAWVRTIAEHLDKGVMLLVDYGFPGREFYHRDRVDGTVMCHYRHTAHPDPFFYPGLQDITSHVDFTAIADAALESGLELAGYCAQGSYLISLGLLDNHAGQFDPAQPTRESLSMAQEIKKLTLPHEMGELFKVVAFSRHYPMALSGFSMQNLAARL